MDCYGLVIYIYIEVYLDYMFSVLVGINEVLLWGEGDVNMGFGVSLLFLFVVCMYNGCRKR